MSHLCGCAVNGAAFCALQTYVHFQRHPPACLTLLPPPSPKSCGTGRRPRPPGGSNEGSGRRRCARDRVPAAVGVHAALYLLDVAPEQHTTRPYVPGVQPTEAALFVAKQNGRIRPCQVGGRRPAHSWPRLPRRSVSCPPCPSDRLAGVRSGNRRPAREPGQFFSAPRARRPWHRSGVPGWYSERLEVAAALHGVAVQRRAGGAACRLPPTRRLALVAACRLAEVFYSIILNIEYQCWCKCTPK